MYMTNEKWEQNNQDYLKESYEETGFTAGGYAVHKLICGGCGRVFYTTIYTKKYCHSYWCGNQANNRRQREYRQMRRAKCAVRIWSASAAVKNSRPNVQMPAIAATPADKKSIENVLQMLQVLKMSTSFFVPSQGLLKIRCRHPALDFTRNRISWSFWPTEKAGRAVRSGQFARSKSAEVRVASGDLKRPQVF